MAIFVSTNNRIIRFSLGKTFSERRKQFVNFLKTSEPDIRAVSQWTMICADNGVAKSLPLNRRATAIYQTKTGSTDSVYGDVVFFESRELPDDRPGLVADDINWSAVSCDFCGAELVGSFCLDCDA